jgi:hypothetical protein
MKKTALIAASVGLALISRPLFAQPIPLNSGRYTPTPEATRRARPRSPAPAARPEIVNPETGEIVNPDTGQPAKPNEGVRVPEKVHPENNTHSESSP